MRSSKVILTVLITVIALSSCNKVPRSGKLKFRNSTDSISYALGYIEAVNFKRSFERTPFQMDSLSYIHFAKAVAKTSLNKRYTDFRINQFDDFNEDIFYKGFINEFAYGKSYFSEMSADIYLRKVFEKKKILKDSLRKEQTKINLKKGVNFLIKNAKRPEVKQTKSGLQYEIIKKGKGSIPKMNSQVRCVYHGTFLNGTVFDSSKERGDTTSFYVNGVIKGWTEALQMMPEGSEWKIYVPSNLAYGENGSGDKIGGNETLIFDINLIEVVKEK